MAKRRKNKQVSTESSVENGNAWVLTTKRVGDRVAGWVVDQLYEQSTRQLAGSERCDVTTFCYPTGAKVVRARLQPAEH
ncbi:hypothetical protein [Oceanicoccus sp. KOV_DT_Chl]|uniref:hypothetical protein n=1 Tax=Oceanicoccus sp. KOV_DT_Chl TaxID=1904639 RepID=UPI000C7BA17C|nr:hypothetical protein [Oceanicoccus sp. KOV_DT_Chl]